MTISPLAGKPAPSGRLVDVPKLLAAYVDLRPDPAIPAQRVCAPARDPGERYRELVRELAEPVADRIEAPATAEQKTRLVHFVR